jgi:hypothetical protein
MSYIEAEKKSEETGGTSETSKSGKTVKRNEEISR